MDDWKRTKAKGRIRAWKKTLSKENLEEYKRRHRLRKEAGIAVEAAVEIVDTAINDQDKALVVEKRNHLLKVYRDYYKDKDDQVKELLPSPLLTYADIILYDKFRVYNNCYKRVENFLTQPPSSPTTPEVVLTMDAITTCELKPSPRGKGLVGQS